MAKNSILPAVELARALEAAGVVDDLNSITRIVIDINPAELVTVYVQRVAGPELTQVAGLLGEMMRDGRAVDSDPKGVRYWVPVADSLMTGDDWFRKVLADAGLRIVEPGPWQDRNTRLYLVEDPGAPEDLAGRTATLTFEQLDNGVHVVQRDVIALWRR